MFFKDTTTIVQLLEVAKAQGILKQVVETDQSQAKDYSEGMTAYEFSLKLQGVQRTDARRNLTETIKTYMG